VAKIKTWSVLSALHAFMSGSEEVGKLLGFQLPQELDLFIGFIQWGYLV
tara:strand:+ start:814 stop:960 length:147 start_codon:yes stop_codon:yes gene_type:complete